MAPETPGFHEGLAVWRDQPQYSIERLETRRGQLVANSGGRIDSIELCLANDSGVPQTLEVELHRADHIWDYRAEPGAPLAKATLIVPPGEANWVSWPLGIDLPEDLPNGSFLRIDALPNKNILWRAPKKIIPGHLIREYHAYAPFYRDAQCPRDYSIEVKSSGIWQKLLEVKDNYQRLRKHPLPAGTSTDKLRVTVTATNGDPSAAICEIRCY